MYQPHSGIIWIIIRHILQMISQGIDQCTRIVTEARMNNQAGRLIYNNQRLVFINNIKRNVFRLYQILIARTIEQKRYDIVGLTR